MSSSSETLKKRVEAVLDMAVTTVSSLSESFMSGAPVVAEESGFSQQDKIETSMVVDEAGGTEVAVEA